YFYEPFLKAYDPELRKDLGVWYTPPEIVQYQVERVDRVLREELDIADGLADDNVVILDPCCGTGAYLVETLKRIHKTLQEKGGSALTAQKLKKAAMERVFGFEILPAPFVVAHLQLGLMLRNLGAPLDHDGDQRAGVYLTNALTGWEPPKKPKNELPLFPELAQERDAANRVKREAPILVILGNPPYNGFAGLAMDEERDLVTAYRTTKRATKPQGQGLNDLYVRFFRMAERRIVEKSGRGIICYISNYSWLEGLSHTGMRERYLEVFDKIWIDCLNGDKYKTGKLTPWGEPDPSIFSTESNREGIQVGTAISLLVRKSPPLETTTGEGAGPTLSDSSSPSSKDQVRFRHLWGKRKHAEVLRNARGEKPAQYEPLSPPVEVGYPLMPLQIDSGYLTWPQLPDLFPVSFPGVKTSRDEFLVDIDREALELRIAAYFDPSLSHEEIARRWPSVMTEGGRYKAREIREYLVKRGPTKGQIVRYAYRPFDVRWVYWEPETKLLDEKRSEYFPHVFEENMTFFTTGRTRKHDVEPPIVTRLLNDLNFMDSGARGFPLFLSAVFRDQDAENHSTNVSRGAMDYLSETGTGPEPLFQHSLAVGHSKMYRDDNLDGIRQGWPRIPLPASRETLLASAELGRRVAALLDTEKPVDGVTCGQIDPRLRSLGVIRKVDGGNLNPDATELDLTAGWGHGGKNGVCMPGRGKVDKKATSDPEQARLLGDQSLDVYLNEVAYWSNVPQAVWEYTIGGYQVIKKWLSYRERAILGRGLHPEEAEYVTEMVRRIAALILMQEDLDRNYQAVKADTWPWPIEKGCGTVCES
ncbi:N-6 DNA methylase, partial [bacterium]|nr:N-6 DNA methylase [bacterium]